MEYRENMNGYAEDAYETIQESDDIDIDYPEVYDVENEDDDDIDIGDSFESEFDPDDPSVSDPGLDDDDAEFLLGGLGIGAAIQGIRKLARNRGRSRRRTRSFRPGSSYLKHRTGSGRVGISSRSNLAGTIRTRRGNVSFRLPSNVSTKNDVKKLATKLGNDIRRNGNAIRRNAAAIRKNLTYARKLNADMKAVDVKHSKIAGRQTKLISGIQKEMQQIQQHTQMQQMLSLFMQPELEEIELSEAVGSLSAGTKLKIKESKFDDNNLPLILAMSGGMGGSGSSNNMWSNPMMMFALMSMMDDND